MFDKLLADYQIVALQETKFTKADNLRVVTHYINSVDAKAQIFWSNNNDERFTGTAGVALILSGAHPFSSVKDVTPLYANVSHQARYLVLDTLLGNQRIFLHVVYAPVDVAHRKHFFDSLPTRFPGEANHVVLGDLNTPIDPMLDEAIPYPHDLGRGELQTWMLELGVLDPWRITFPDQRLFSGPNQRNRIDYCLLTANLYDSCYRGSRYVTDQKWYHEDHYPVEFHLSSPTQPEAQRLPWKCPRWLLRTPIVQETLERTLFHLCHRLKWFPTCNPGALLDEHKDQDRQFLRDMQRTLKNKDDNRLRHLRNELRMAKALEAVCPTEDTRTALTAAKSNLKALEDLLSSRREKTKFDRDVSEGERGSAYFFRAPTQTSYRVAIPSVAKPDGTTTSIAKEMAAEHRHYWGSIFQSPSWDLQASIPKRSYDSVGLQELLKHTKIRLTDALLLVLRHMGFGNIFCDSVMSLFRGTLVSVLVNGTGSKFFELGCGVRQGDPLSPALFVLFIEPMLCYLRATTGHLGLPVPKDAEPHHLLAFADDCTGLLRNLGLAPGFIAAVETYARAAGLRLNVHKTHLLPFSPLPRPLRDTLEHEGWHVITDNGSARLLGVYMSPSLPTCTRFPRVLEAMVLRCKLWRYRARTLLGRAVILRAIVLPLLWYTAAVTRVPPDVVLQVKRLCKSFLFKKEISPDQAFKGPMAEEWLYWPTSKGGLGLPETLSFSNALQLCSLRDAMLSANTHHVIPRWFAAAAVLFSEPLRHGGQVFDLLYAPIPNGLTAQEPWAGLGHFWIEPLQVWHRLVARHCLITDFEWALLEMPYWQNHFLRANAAGRHTGQASSNAHWFYEAGYARIHDFVRLHGQLPTKDLCLTILREEDFTLRAQWTGAAGHFLRQVTRLLGAHTSLPPSSVRTCQVLCVPPPTDGHLTASSSWKE